MTTYWGNLRNCQTLLKETTDSFMSDVFESLAHSSKRRVQSPDCGSGGPWFESKQWYQIQLKLPGTRKVTSSFTASTSSISSLNSFFNFDINNSTRISGADAPEDIPIVLQFLILSIGNLLSEFISCESGHPVFCATSTNLTELDEFLLPITKNISHLSAICFTAIWRFVVA